MRDNMIGHPVSVVLCKVAQYADMAAAGVNYWMVGAASVVFYSLQLRTVLAVFPAVPEKF